MRKMGISALILVCLLATVPVMAVEGGQAGSWWDGVVGWVTGMVGSMTNGADSSLGSDEFTAPETGTDLGPNGLGASEGGAGANAEPNG